MSRIKKNNNFRTGCIILVIIFAIIFIGSCIMMVYDYHEDVACIVFLVSFICGWGVIHTYFNQHGAFYGDYY
jgi:hypothetical protein